MLLPIQCLKNNLDLIWDYFVGTFTLSNGCCCLECIASVHVSREVVVVVSCCAGGALEYNSVHAKGPTSICTNSSGIMPTHGP